ncbi:HEAT repeat domain-containing protein [candidate division KSB1 bacterium]|nr:HEAT repeat domain-containing protein [candidate division KSB1 bacterium]
MNNIARFFIILCLLPVFVWAQQADSDSVKFERHRNETERRQREAERYEDEAVHRKREAELKRQEMHQYEREMERAKRDMLDMKYELDDLDYEEIEMAHEEIARKMEKLQPMIDSVVAVELARLPEVMDDFEFEFYMPEIPAIDVEVPPVPPLPPLAPMPHIRIDHDMVFDAGENPWDFHYHIGGVQKFRDLNDDERTRVQAIRCLGKMEADQAIPAITKIMKNDDNPAFRYEAVRQLRYFLERADVVSLLVDTAKNDTNVHVRKMAVDLLGKADSDQARNALHQMIDLK